MPVDVAADVVYIMFYNKIYGNVKHGYAMAKKVTTVYLEEHQKEALEAIASDRGERVATVLREAIEWYTAITPYLRDQLGELTRVYEELTPHAIIGRLIADDERRRNGRNTKEAGIQAIKMDTEQIISILLRADAAAILQSIAAARAAGCDCADEFDDNGMEVSGQ